MERSRLAGGSDVISRPPMEICPELTSSRPAISLSVVDLPQPEGPSSTEDGEGLQSIFLFRFDRTGFPEKEYL